MGSVGQVKDSDFATEVDERRFSPSMSEQAIAKRIVKRAICFLLIALIGGVVACSRRAVEVKESGNFGASSSSRTAGSNGANSALPAVPTELMEAEIRMLDGGTIRLADYAGKVIVLDLWATWCPPCRDEIPHLVSLNDELKSRGVEFIGLTVDANDNARKLRDFAQRFGINYRIGWADEDFALAFMGDYGSIPQTFVITRDGRVLKKFVGFDPERSPARLREAIDRALDGGS